MHPLILVSMLAIAGIALLAVVALWRGWFRLKSVPAEARVHFMLFGKMPEPPAAAEPGGKPSAEAGESGDPRTGPKATGPTDA